MAPRRRTVPFRFPTPPALSHIKCLTDCCLASQASHHVFEKDQNFEGWLDDIRFYDFALTDEVRPSIWLLCAGVARVCIGMQAR